MELTQFAQIFIGILVSRERSDAGEFSYSLFHFDQDTKKQPFPIITTKNCFDQKLTKKGDIIFRLVCPNKMVYVDDESLENLLIPSQMCIIRGNQEQIDQAFLAWYLASDACKEQLNLSMVGSSIQKISVESLRKIKIPNLSLDKQKKVGELMKLWDQEKRVLNDIIESKERLYNVIIHEIIEEEEL